MDSSLWNIMYDIWFSYDLFSGYLNWSQQVNSKSDPIIDGDHILRVENSSSSKKS